jgi:gas vesicle protein
MAGAFLGGLVGAGLAFFLSPRSGEENRRLVAKKAGQLRDTAADGFDNLKENLLDMKEDITESVMAVFGEVSEATISLYEDATTLFAKQLAALQKNMDDIDKDKYLAVVDNISDILAKNKRNSATNISKMKKYWVRNWKNIQEVLS